MKKSKKMLTNCGRIVVSLCVLWMISCAQDYEDLHTILVSDTIPANETESHFATNTESDISSETTPVTAFITFCESSGCYEGKFLSLYTDYAKSELTTDILLPDSTADIIVSATFLTDTSGDMVRFIARFYNDGVFHSEKVFTGMTLTDMTVDAKCNVSVPDSCNGLQIVIQAKYETKKGGSRTDVITVRGLKISYEEECNESDEIKNSLNDQSYPAEQETSLEDNTDDIYDNENNEDIRSEYTENTVLSDENDNLVNDGTLSEVTDNSGDSCEHNDETTDISIGDETDDIGLQIYDESSDETNDIYEITLTNLRTEYSKCHIEMSDYIRVSAKEINADMSFYSDSSGDMVRAVVECYDEQYGLIESKALTGARSSAGEWVTNLRKCVLSEETAYIKLYAEAKYETAKGGSRNDVIICRARVQ